MDDDDPRGGRGEYAEAGVATTTAFESKEEGEKATDFDLDENLLHLGVKGFYPSGLYLILSVFLFLLPSQFLSSHVASFTPEHRCQLPPNDVDTSFDSFVAIADAIPKRVVGGVETVAQCERFEHLVFEHAPGGFSVGNSTNSSMPIASTELSSGVVFDASRSTVPCDHGWEYVNATSGSSVVVDFDLVCAKSWIPGFTTSIFNVGQAFGGLLVQPLADRIGRKWVMLMANVGIGLTGIFTATLANDILAYCVFKFFLGAFCGSSCLVLFVMLIELYGPKHRMYAGMVVEPIWGLGAAAVGVASFSFPFWRDYNIGVSLPLFLSVFVYFIYPSDSLPWLMVNGRQREVRSYLEKKLKAVGKKLILLSESEMYVPDLLKELKPLPSPPPTNENVTRMSPTVAGESTKTMLTDGRVIKQLVIFTFVTTVDSLVFWALSLMSTDLSGDRNVSLFLSGIAEVPGYIMAGISLHFLGRRGPTILFHLLVGFFMAIVAAILVLAPTPIPTALDVFSQTCYFAAKLSISAAYAIVFLYIPEAFPTNVRNTCFGVIDALARLGGIVAPYCSLLSATSHAFVPVFLFAVLALAAAILALFLPEVHGEALPDTLEDVKRLGEGTRTWNFTGKRKKIREKTMAEGFAASTKKESDANDGGGDRGVDVC